MSEKLEAENVRIEQTMGWSQLDGRRNMKRWSHPYTIRAECPVCGGELEWDHYLSYPEPTEPIEVVLNCTECSMDDDRSDDWGERTCMIRLNVEMELVDE